jgi:WD40 repeat protein
MEVEAIWKKLKRPRLLALIGPSGAGKSSFLRAGLLPTLPQGWRVILSTPGSRPFSALAQALIPVFAGDLEELQLFPGFERDTAVSLFSKWRQGAEHALVIVDQFEELFTLNPPEVQEAFSTLLGKLVLEADVHILLSLRDDFLFHCQKHESLSPVFSELTPLGTLSPSALRRALVQPALACGYRFEDDALVDEMVSEVSHERGVLPLLAFAASRLWERRDRERGLLTREAYQEIEGVGGALAQHAEETLSRIGEERTPLARELFRNLVTAQGTRASREVEELLSIFPKEDERKAAEEVLRELIAARLLTSYEDSIEIIHESLLSAWPRFVQWRHQDEGGALLRDQLRQAAQAWLDRGRPDDLLWTGRSYGELSLWRESYTGGLSSTEEAFAQAAAKLAGRTRRRRQVAVVTVIAVLLGVVGVVTSLWRRSVLEVSRREAAQILALGRLELQDRPTSALAHALASLERADSDPARRFAVEALWHGAPAIVLAENINEGDFSPDGNWLATGGGAVGTRLWSASGGAPKSLGIGRRPAFGPGSDFLASGGDAVRIRSVPDGKELRSLQLEGFTWFRRRGAHLFSLTLTSQTMVALREWSALGASPDVTSLDFSGVGDYNILPSGDWLMTGRGNGVYLSPLRSSSQETLRLIGKHEAKVEWINPHPTAPRAVSTDETGEIKIWSFSGASGRLERTFRSPVPGSQAHLDPTDTWVIAAPGGPSTPEVAFLWDLKGPPNADPVVLRNGNTNFNRVTVDAQGDWFLTANGDFGVLWPLHTKRARVLRGQAPPYIDVAFTPDGKSLVSASDDGTVRLWPLSVQEGRRSRILMKQSNLLLGTTLAVDPEGKYAVVSHRFSPPAFLVPLEGGGARPLSGFSEAAGPFAFLEGGKLAAARFGNHGFRVWDVTTEEGQNFQGGGEDEDCPSRDRFEGLVNDLEFLPDGRLVTVGQGGVRVWVLPQGTSEEIRPCGKESPYSYLAVDRSRNRFLVADSDPMHRVGTLTLYDLESGTSETISSHGNGVTALALDPTGTLVVTGSFDGVLRVGPITGEEPHLLYGGSLEVYSIAVSPDGKWIASGSQDGAIRLWPMPEGTPFHTLPYQEILDRLRGLTNLRVVPDEGSATGYRVEIGPFPGWKRVPEW